MLLRFFRTPPRYSIALGSSMTALIPACIALHLAVGAWMISNTRLFPREGGIGVSVVDDTAASVSLPESRRLTQRTTTPFLLLLALVVSAMLLRAFSFVVFTCLKRTVELASCGRCNIERQCAAAKTTCPLRTTVAQPTFSHARSHGLLAGVPGYHMLQNPRFAQAFAISRSFASKSRQSRLTAVLDDSEALVGRSAQADDGGSTRNLAGAVIAMRGKAKARGGK